MHKTKPKPTFIFENCSRVCTSLCTTVIHNTAQNSSGNFHFHPLDNYHSSDDVYWRGGGTTNSSCGRWRYMSTMQLKNDTHVAHMNSGNCLFSESGKLGILRDHQQRRIEVKLSMADGLQEVVLRCEFHQNWSSGLGAVGDEICPLIDLATGLCKIVTSQQIK